MKRLAAVAGTGVAALAALILAAPVGAAVTPKLAITPTNGGDASLIISGGATSPADDAFQKIQIFVPTGFGVNAPDEGAVVGKVTGHAVVEDVDAAKGQRFSGTVTAVGITNPAFAFEQAACDDTTHAAVWSMQIAVNDTRVTIPIFVDKTVGSEAQFGPYKLVMCLRSPDLPSGDPNRSPAGVKLQSFVLTLGGFTIPTTRDEYRWRALWTPYAPGTGTANPAGAVEAQSVVFIPAGLLSLGAKGVPQSIDGELRTIVKLSGRLQLGGLPAPNVKLGFSHGPSTFRLSQFGSVTTGDTGTFLLTSTFSRPTGFQGGVTIRRQELGTAGCTPSFGVPCVNASIGGFRLLSRLILVK
jgi:hypothetical protein